MLNRPQFMIEEKQDLEKSYSTRDPWGYESNPEDQRRRSILLSEIPGRAYRNVLDIGCGHGFITKALPGERITGVDISANALAHAKENASEKFTFIESDLFNLPNAVSGEFDLIVVTGVLYPQYIGKARSLVYQIVDNLLAKDGLLISVHIDEWYTCKFPYCLVETYCYNYREFLHRLEVYSK